MLQSPNGIVDKNNIIGKAKNILFPTDSAIDGHLYIGTKQYEIQSFDTEFQQGVDYKGQPQQEVKGGLLAVTLSQPADDLLNTWMFQPETFHDGIISFAPISKTASAVIKIIFKKGRCVSYEKLMGRGVGIQFRILISAKYININGIEHKNEPRYILA